MAAEVTAVALAGGFIGLIAVAIFKPGAQVTQIDLASVVAGALGAVGINRTLRR